MSSLYLLHSLHTFLYETIKEIAFLKLFLASFFDIISVTIHLFHELIYSDIILNSFFQPYQTYL